METYPRSMVLVVVNGHTTVNSGELVYHVQGKKDPRHAMPLDVGHFNFIMILD